MEGHNGGDDADADGIVVVFAWALIALVFAIAACAIMFAVVSAATIPKTGFPLKLLAVIVGGNLGFAGALTGDALSNAAYPDKVPSRGESPLRIAIRLFWACGPQMIGLAAGTSAGFYLVLRIVLK